MTVLSWSSKVLLMCGFGQHDVTSRANWWTARGNQTLSEAFSDLTRNKLRECWGLWMTTTTALSAQTSARITLYELTRTTWNPFFVGLRHLRKFLRNLEMPLRYRGLKRRKVRTFAAAY